MAAPALDPERLLWIPGAKTIFVPKAIAAPALDDLSVTTLAALRSDVIVSSPWLKILKSYATHTGWEGGVFIQQDFLYGR